MPSLVTHCTIIAPLRSTCARHRCGPHATLRSRLPIGRGKLQRTMQNATPADRGLRVRGGRGLHAIMPHSVMPYDSITGELKTCSRSVMSCRGKAEDDERMKRNGTSTGFVELLRARARSAWCILGTAVNHVGLNSSSQSKNCGA